MAPRIDTIRARIALAREVLERVEPDLADLHALAYDRPTGGDRPHVAGGSRDYALDRHGDPQARELLNALKDALDDGLRAIIDTANDARSYLNTGDPLRRRTTRTATADEVEAALAAQARRRARGEYTPNRTYPQPAPGS